MTTEHIIETFRDWKRTWKPTRQIANTLDTAIEELQYNEEKLHLIITRKNQFIRRLESVNEEYRQQVEQLKKERDDARAESKRLNRISKHLLWEKGSK